MPEDIVDKILEKLPAKEVYDDAVKPMARQVGHLTEDLMKTLRLALAPVQFGAVLQDRFTNFIDKSVKNVPEDRRVCPPPQIIGPVLEGIRYEPDDTPIDQMFSALLSNSMDGANQQKAHPSFPMIIRQLSRDEAVILHALKKSVYDMRIILPQYKYNELNNDQSDPYTALLQYLIYLKDVSSKNIREHTNFPLEELFIQDNFFFYLNHLIHLGLIHIRQNKTHQPRLLRNNIRVHFQIDLLSVGRIFMDSCTLKPDDANTTAG